MISSPVRATVLSLAVAAASSLPAFAQSETPTVELILAAGRPLRVALDRTIRLTGVGQEVSGTLTEPVYVYDRIVFPIGTPVHGHVARLIPAPTATRIQAMVSGVFSVPQQVVLAFDTVLLGERAISIDATAAPGTEHVERQVAAGADDPAAEGITAKAKQEALGKMHEAIASAKQAEHEAIAAIKEPDKRDRVQEWLFNHLPYHPQYLHRGTVYDAELRSPVPLGWVAAARPVPAGTLPAPGSVLTARLVAAVDSGKSTRGTPVTAVVTEPVFSADHELILAEGALLEGEVTYAQPARRWHRNGQLRMLFEDARPSAAESSATLLASLYSVDVSSDTRLSLDEEGGAAISNSKTRFIAPTLAILALRGSMDDHDQHQRFDNDGDAYDLGRAPAATIPSQRRGARVIGGFFGFGFIGMALGQVARPVGIALAAVGAARTTYRNVVGKGDEVTFAAHTPIQVKLAPGKAADK
jgi:hypothetical protein